MVWKVVAVAALLIVPTLLFGVPLGFLTGDWLVSFLVWPLALVFGLVLAGAIFSLFRFLDWAFDD